MAKLSLLIKNTGQGVNTAYECLQGGDNSWAQHADDVRDIVELFVNANGGNGDLKTINYLSFLQKGYIFASIYLPEEVERLGDNIAFFLYVPYTLEIGQSQMAALIKQLTQQIKQGISRQDIDALMAMDYPPQQRPMFLPIGAASVDSAAVALQPQQTLADFCGDKAFAAPFFKYERVFLIDPKTWPSIPAGLALLNPDGKPLSGGLCKISSKASGYGIAVNDISVGGPVLAPKGLSVTITYSKEGYADLSTPPFVLEADYTIQPPQASGLQFKLLRSRIEVMDAKGELIDDASVTVNGQQPEDGRWLISPGANDIAIVARAPGFTSSTARLKGKDLTSADPIQIVLERKSYAYLFKVKVAHGDTIEFEVDTHGSLERSPLQGYECGRPTTSRPNHLKYTGKKMMAKAFGAGVVAGALIVGLIWLIAALCSPGKPAIATTPAPPPAVKTDTTAKDTAGAAVPDSLFATPLTKYLDGNDKWDKAQLEKLGAKGLFDAINYARLEKIKEFAPKLKGSARGDSLLIWVSEGMQKYPGMKPVQEQMTGGPALEYQKIKNAYTGEWKAPIKKAAATDAPAQKTPEEKKADEPGMGIE